MRNKDEILNDKRIIKVIKDTSNDICSKLKVEIRSNKASDKCIVSMTCIDGWEHLSVSHKNKIPSWLTMEEMKELFFNDNEEAFQFHPKIDNYVNNNEYTLHIWRRTNGEMCPPPSILVGIRPNHIEEDIEEAKRLQEYIGNPLSDTELKLMKLTVMKDEKQIKDVLDSLPLHELVKLANKFGIK